jgi:hypothetical protein
MWSQRTFETRPVRAGDRQRLLLALIGAAAVVVTVAVGLAMLVMQAVHPTQDAGGDAPSLGGQSGASSPAQLRDQIAAAPMASVDAAAATRPDPALTPAPPIRLPYAVVGRGPAGIQVYDHSSEGAVAQLAAIDVAVLEAMDVTYTGEVHSAWALPGGPSLEQWDIATNVTAFLRGSRQAAAKDEATSVQVTPAGGLIKGTDGPDWVLACVLLDVRATIQTDYRMGWGHCARMQWSDGRWQIGPGGPPATAPSAWPGSRAAVAAGWMTWESAEQGVQR